MQPLIDLLDSDQPITRVQRNYLSMLLRGDKRETQYLHLKKRSGKRLEQAAFLRECEMFERAEDLYGSTITEAFCQSLFAVTGMNDAGVEIDDERETKTYRLGWKEYDPDWEELHVEVKLTLKVGKKLNKDQTQKIISAEFGVSLSTVKRALQRQENARLPAL